MSDMTAMEAFATVLAASDGESSPDGVDANTVDFYLPIAESMASDLRRLGFQILPAIPHPKGA